MSLVAIQSTPKPQSLESTIRTACTLQRDIARMTDELDACKATIRAAAAGYALSAHHNPVYIETSFGSCSVSYVGDKLEIVGKRDASTVRECLSEALAARLFTTKVVLRPDAGDIVLALPAAQRAQLTGKLEFRAQSARVQLPRIVG